MTLVQSPIDGIDLEYPAAAVGVLQRHDFRLRPMEMKSDVGYFLVEPLQRVA